MLSYFTRKKIFFICLGFLLLITSFFALRTVYLRYTELSSQGQSISQKTQEKTVSSQTKQHVHIPLKGAHWYVQLSGKVPPGREEEVYVVDLFAINKGDISFLHKMGKYVICYMDAGSYAYTYPDHNSFPQDVLGNTLHAEEHKRWVDIRKDSVKNIMARRFDLAQEKDCDGMVFGHIDAYTRESGFSLSYQNQLDYNRWLAHAAHARGLAAGMQNNPAQVKDLVHAFDFAVVEECFAHHTCDAFLPFIQQGKAVFGIEYRKDLGIPFCREAQAKGFSWAWGNKNLAGEDDFHSCFERRTSQHISPPEEGIKAVYLSQCGASSSSLRRHILSLLETSALNAVVIDIKDSFGGIAFPNPLQEEIVPHSCRVSDMKEFIDELHAKGIYVIGRITVFQDNAYARAHPSQSVQQKGTQQPWRNNHGIAFVDVGSRAFWDYIVAISRIAYHDYHFDELNYDYIRYPSDGDLKEASFPLSDYTHREDSLEKFFSYLHTAVKVPDPYGNTPIISANLFGATLYHEDDLHIGQVLERVVPYFDYIAPMIYPSHYSYDTFGLGNPNVHPYLIVQKSLEKGIQRILQKKENLSLKDRDVRQVFRPWLQDFDYGKQYTAEDVRAQIQAVEDLGIHGWMLWDPRNRYTPAALPLPQKEKRDD